MTQKPPPPPKATGKGTRSVAPKKSAAAPAAPPADIPADGQPTVVPAVAADFVKRAAARIPDKPLPPKKPKGGAPKTLDAITAASAPVPPPRSSRRRQPLATPSSVASPPPPPVTPAKPGTSKLATADRIALFINAYIANGRNGTQAAITAGYSANSAAAQASRLLKDSKIIAQVEARSAEIAAKFAITPENVLRELSHLVFFDPRKLLNDDGSLKDMHELDDATAAAIAGLEITEEFDGHGESRVHIGYSKKVKIADKNSAIDKAMKHLGMFDADNRQKAPPQMNLTVVLVKAGAQPGDKAKVINQ